MKEKSLAKNSLFFVLYKFMYVVFPLITSVYVSHVIYATGVGKVASAQNIAQYFVLIASLGIPTYGIREIAKARRNQEELNKKFSELFTINFVSTLFCVIVYYLLILSIGQFNEELGLYFIMGISIVLNILNVDWFFQGIEEYAYITKRSFFVRLLSLVLLILMVRSSSDYEKYAMVNVLGISGNYLFNFLNLRKHNIIYTIKGLDLSMHLKTVCFLLCTTIATELYTMVDLTMLTFMCSDEIVGYYSNSMKIIKIIVTVVSAIGGVLLPRLSLYKSQNKIAECEKMVNNVFMIMFFLLIPCGIGAFLLSDSIIVVLFGTTFSNATITLKILSFIIFALGFYDLFGTQVLLTFNGEKRLLFSTVIGAIINILLNSVLIPMYQQNGAAVASVISQFAVTICVFAFSKKYIHLSLKKDFLLKTFIASVIMVLVVVVLNIYMNNGIVFLCVSVIVGGLIYLGVSFWLKNEVMQIAGDFIYKRVKLKK